MWFTRWGVKHLPTSTPTNIVLCFSTPLSPNPPSHTYSEVSTYCLVRLLHLRQLQCLQRERAALRFDSRFCQMFDSTQLLQLPYWGGCSVANPGSSVPSSPVSSLHLHNIHSIAVCWPLSLLHTHHVENSQECRLCMGCCCSEPAYFSRKKALEVPSSCRGRSTWWICRAPFEGRICVRL